MPTLKRGGPTLGSQHECSTKGAETERYGTQGLRLLYLALDISPRTGNLPDWVLSSFWVTYILRQSCRYENTSGFPFTQTLWSVHHCSQRRLFQTLDCLCRLQPSLFSLQLHQSQLGVVLLYNVLSSSFFLSGHEVMERTFGIYATLGIYTFDFEHAPIYGKLLFLLCSLVFLARVGPINIQSQCVLKQLCNTNYRQLIQGACIIEDLG